MLWICLQQPLCDLCFSNFFSATEKVGAKYSKRQLFEGGEEIPLFGGLEFRRSEFRRMEIR